MYQLFNLPQPVLILLGLLAGTSIAGAIAFIDAKIAAIVFLGFILMGIAVGMFIFLRDWRQKRKAASLAGDLNQHTGAAPTGINDAGQRARLDELRRSFGEGLTKFGGVENVYKFPWYLIVGEPGSGKTEAVRHCNVGFPPGLQNELQGVGGTINMNWWFTNQAVFLDTAGRLMFEEVKAGENNEWREFLGLLKRNRPTCPINGLLLVIPADSLIKDSEEEINRKAGKIAQQFDVIQRTLDIRFPVFILITKCDLLSGFREFFDDFSDAQSQHQMIGWSNRDERDAPFRPDMVTEYIGTVVNRIKKRRFSLLRDPIPQKNLERRTDEVDALFGLPQSMQLIAPKLRSYLEKIFIAGPWSPKPLFLRGIYFNSSMREGSAMDQELALALNLPPDELRESKQWERERAYFLRDLFTEKVFRERGLVTRATNTRKMLRTRSLVLWGTGIALALLLIGSSFYFARQLQDSINEQSRYWAVAKNWERPGVWNPVVAPEAPGATRADYKGGETVLTGGSGNISRVAFHEQLKELAAQEFKTGWVFKPMLHWVRVDGDRQLAQRIVFEGSVISPLVKAARQRMLLEKFEEAPDANLSNGARLLREANALAALIRIESDAVSKERNLEALPQAVMEPLLVYATARSEPLDDKGQKALTNAITRTYSDRFPDRPSGAWPPPWLPLGSAALPVNKPIENGVKRLQALAGESVKSQVEGLEKIKALRDDLRLFRAKEREMDSTVATPEPPEKRTAKLDDLLGQLGTVKKSIDARLAEARQQGLFVGESLILRSVYDRLVGDSQAGANGSFKVVKEAVRPQLKNDKERLFADVDQILDTTLSGLKEQIARGFNEGEIKELAEMDSYLADFGNGRRNYEVRWETYLAAQKQATTDDRLGNLIGTGWAAFGTVQTAIADQRKQVEFVRPKLPEPFSATCLFFLDRAERLRLDRIVRTYLSQSSDRFNRSFFYPLVNPAGGTFMDAGARRQAIGLIDVWRRDFKGESFQKINPAQRARLEAFGSELEKIPGIDAAINNFSVTVSYDYAPNAAFYFKYRAAIFKGREYDTAEQNFDGKYDYGEKFSVLFKDFKVAPTRTDSVSKNVETLVREGNGGTVSIAVGEAILKLRVNGTGQPPNFAGQPNKQRILDTLR